MLISFKNQKLMKKCSEIKRAIRAYGEVGGKLLVKRMNELSAATCLNDLVNLPQARCHELKGRSKGMFSVDLEYPYRLVFEPTDNPIPKKQDGGLDWKNIKSIKILGVEDTHDKKSDK